MTENSTPDKESRPVPIWLIGGAVGLGGLIVLLAVLSFLPSVKELPKTQTIEQQSEAGADITLTTLANQPDLESTRAFLAANASKIVKALKELPGENSQGNAPLYAGLLTPSQVEETAQLGPTKLDAHHIVSALFWREIANRISGSGDLWSSLRKDPDKKAAMASFAWVCRLVAFSGGGSEGPEGIPVDPQLTLKKGWGSALDRALIFLALRGQQIPQTEAKNPPDLLLQLDAGQLGKSRVLVGVWIPSRKDWWILDPALGLPLEDADPDWAWLGSMPIGETGQKPLQPLKWADIEWDLRPDWWKKVDISIVCTLNQFPRRMESIEKILGQAGLNVSIFTNPSQQSAIAEKELSRLGKASWKVGVWKPGISLLQSYVIPLEGGTDAEERRFRFQQLGSVAWDALPPALRIDVQLGGNQSVLSRGPWLINFPKWDAGLTSPVPLQVAERVGELFGSPFLASSYAPGKTKDLLLRGKWTKLTTDLVGEQDELKKNLRSYETNRQTIDQLLKEWSATSEKKYADLTRVQRRGNPDEMRIANSEIEKLWKNAGGLYSVVSYALARSRGTEIAYILAQIRHEEAERAGRLAGDPQKIAMAWDESASAWRRFNEEYANGMVTPISLSSWAEALALSGQKSKAIATLEQAPTGMPPILRLPLLLKAKVLAKGSN